MKTGERKPIRPRKSPRAESELEALRELRDAVLAFGDEVAQCCETGQRFESGGNRYNSSEVFGATRCLVELARRIR